MMNILMVIMLVKAMHSQDHIFYYIFKMLSLLPSLLFILQPQQRARTKINKNIP